MNIELSIPSLIDEMTVDTLDHEAKRIAALLTLRRLIDEGLSANRINKTLAGGLLEFAMRPFPPEPWFRGYFFGALGRFEAIDAAFAEAASIKANEEDMSRLRDAVNEAAELSQPGILEWAKSGGLTRWREQRDAAVREMREEQERRLAKYPGLQDRRRKKRAA